ncbi:MAG: NAD(P)H-dependent oxidoreductase [Bacteroides sp.]|jgi:putative NADPH-quinone reductase|nr:NAD(P)H-dependent oxidoreductase [Bacteroides sp.]
MKTVVILAHPNIANSHINKVWTGALSQAHPEVHIHDIYALYPNWNIDVQAEQTLLEQADRVILEFPFQWYNMPPLLKKWLDDVFAYGWCYGEGGDKLAGKEIGVAVSTAGVEDVYNDSVYGTIGDLLRPIESTAKFVGAKYLSHHVFHGAFAPDVDERLAKDIDNYLGFVTK